MVKCVFDKTTGIYIGGARWDEPEHDPAKHVVIELKDFPNPPDSLILNETGNGARKAKAADKKNFKEAHPQLIGYKKLLDLLVDKRVLKAGEVIK